MLELVLEEAKAFTTDEIVTFTGNLQLNSDPLKFPLTLVNAVVQ